MKFEEAWSYFSGISRNDGIQLYKENHFFHKYFLEKDTKGFTRNEREAFYEGYIISRLDWE